MPSESAAHRIGRSVRSRLCQRNVPRNEPSRPARRVREPTQYAASTTFARLVFSVIVKHAGDDCGLPKMDQPERVPVPWAQYRYRDGKTLIALYSEKHETRTIHADPRVNAIRKGERSLSPQNQKEVSCWSACCLRWACWVASCVTRPNRHMRAFCPGKFMMALALVTAIE